MSSTRETETRKEVVVLVRVRVRVLVEAVDDEIDESGGWRCVAESELECGI